MIANPLWAVLSLLWGQAPAAALTPGDLVADELVYEASARMLEARGHAVLHAQGGLLRSDELDYDREGGTAAARGSVVFLEDHWAMVAESALLHLEDERLVLESAVVYDKQQPVDASWSQDSPGALRQRGRNVLSFSGRSIDKVGPGHFTVEGLRLHPCDCGSEPPSWSIRAERADVLLGERLWGYSFLYIGEVPVLPLPPYLPLSNRRSGLLVPRPSKSAQSGFTLEQPLFLTLGPSRDLTLSPSYAFGVAESDGARAGLKGPQLGFEYRYALGSSSGRWTAAMAYDLHHDLVAAPGLSPDGPLGGKKLADRPRGPRGDLRVEHREQLGGGFFDRADVVLLSDGNYLSDTVADLFVREADYVRSTAQAGLRRPDYALTLDGTYFQDIRSRPDLFGQRAPLFGPGASATFQRVGELSLAAPRRPLWGGLGASLQAALTPFFVPGRSGSDDGADGLGPASPGYPGPDRGEGNGRLDPGERANALRLRLDPTLSTPAALGSYVRAELSLGYRQRAYLLAGDPGLLARGFPIAGAWVETELQRHFGSLSHSIAPRVELRYVPKVFGASLPRLYDELETEVPQQGMTQAIAAVRSTLSSPSWGFRRASIELGQGVDLRKQAAADAFARVELAAGPLSFGAGTSYSVGRREIGSAVADLVLADARGDNLHLHYERLRASLPEQLRRGAEMLFGAASAEEGPLFEQMSGGVMLRPGWGFFAQYDGAFQPSTRRFLQHVVGLGYGGQCDCFRVVLNAVLPPTPSLKQAFNYLGFTFDLSRLGQLAP